MVINWLAAGITAALCLLVLLVMPWVLIVSGKVYFHYCQWVSDQIEDWTTYRRVE